MHSRGIKHALKHVLCKKDLQKPKIVIYTDSLVALDLIMRFHNPSSYSIQLEVFKIRSIIRKVLQIDTVKKYELRK